MKNKNKVNHLESNLNYACYDSHIFLTVFEILELIGKNPLATK